MAHQSHVIMARCTGLTLGSTQLPALQGYKESQGKRLQERDVEKETLCIWLVGPLSKELHLGKLRIVIKVESIVRKCPGCLCKVCVFRGQRTRRAGVGGGGGAGGSSHSKASDSQPLSLQPHLCVSFNPRGLTAAPCTMPHRSVPPMWLPASSTPPGWRQAPATQQPRRLG